MFQRRITTGNPRSKPTERKSPKRISLAEILLWTRINRGQLKGYRFLRQKTIDGCTLDFYCRELNLAIEIEGEMHDLKVHEDETRRNQLDSLGISLIRFMDEDVKQNMDGVLKKLTALAERFEKEHSALIEQPLPPPETPAI